MDVGARAPVAKRSRTFDALVIGAGAAGLAAARALSEAGLRLAVLEARPPATLGSRAASSAAT